MRALLERALRWEGSTVLVGLLRVGLGLLLWAEHARNSAWWKVHDPLHMAVGTALLASSMAMVVGWRSRVATGATAALLAGTYFGFGLLGGETEKYVHAHSYLLLVAVGLVALMPNDRSLSVDRWLALERGDAAPQRGALWPLALLRLQVALVYFWGAFDKTNVGFLSGARLQQIMDWYLGSHEGLRVPGSDLLLTVSSVGTVALEYALAVGLFFPWGRRWLMPLGVLFHAAIYLSVPVGTFSILTVFLYLAFFPPEQVERVARRVLGGGARGGGSRSDKDAEAR